MTCSITKSWNIQFKNRTYLLTLRRDFLYLCVFFIILFFMLGIWQIHRYDFKKRLVTTYQQRFNNIPLDFNKLDLTKDLQFQRIATHGFYLNNLTIFIQNQFYHDQLGYEVITPLKIPNQKKLLLIDRGWIAKPINNQTQPIVDIFKEQSITGYIKYMNEYQFILGKNLMEPEKKPIILQKIDIPLLTSISHQDYFPFIIRLDPSNLNGFTRDWTISTVLPERHMAYAIQWFAMALVLIIAYIAFCLERVVK